MKKLLFIATLLLASACKNQIQGDLIITNANVVDVALGKIQTSQDIVIRGNKIDTILDANVSHEYVAVQTVDGSGQYVIPGLWDAHTHLLWRTDEFELHNKLMIASGVTGFRDMWGSDSIAKLVKQKMEQGNLVHQHIYRANHMLDGPPEMYEGSGEVIDPTRARIMVDSLVQKTNTDFIKVYSLLSRESFLTIAIRATELGVDFAGHVPFEVPLEEAVKAGLRSSEHLTGLKTALSDARDFFFSNPQIPWFVRMDRIDESQSNARIDTVAEILVRHNSFVVPTFVVEKGKYLSYLNDSVSDGGLNAFIPEYRRQKWVREKYAGFDKAPWERKFERNREIVRLLNERGVKIIAGTDAALVNSYTYPGFSLYEELLELRQAGLSTEEVLKSATLYPAELVGMQDSIGQVKSKYLADLVVLRNNPLEDVHNLSSISGVISQGAYFDADTLDTFLSDAKTLAVKLKASK